ncbi:MAG: recombination protein RecR [Acidobacteria bacterium]|nr:recombination protein RecR [Acidobacteriota bacterium]
MKIFTAPLAHLIDALKRLPGIGPKSAQRIAFFLLRADGEYVQTLLHAIREARDSVRLCERCNNYTDREICEICADKRRDSTTICVVEKPFDIAPIEKTGQYRGLYHVLHGVLSPIDGVGPEDLRIKNLLPRLGENQVIEVIVATNPDVEGEATAIYLAKLLKPLEIKVSRIALGLPVGSDLEFIDEVTIIRALQGRTPL